MKKFARFLILALALSALLCVTAFAGEAGAFEVAANGASFELYDSGDRFDVTYTGVTSGKQYVIMMIAKDNGGNYTINDESILYINQAAASGNSITFTVFPKEMADAQILLTGGAEPVVLGYYVTETESGSDVTIDLVGDSNGAQITVSADGETLAVKNDTACVVAYTTDGGATYKTLPATANANGGYDYDLSALPAGATVSIAVRGDSNGDGMLDSTDYGRMNAVLLGKTSLSGAAKFAADANGDGEVDSTDYGRMNAVLLGKTSMTW